MRARHRLVPCIRHVLKGKSLVHTLLLLYLYMPTYMYIYTCVCVCVCVCVCACVCCRATRLFCDVYNPHSKTYCKRLQVLCPEHSRDPKVSVGPGPLGWDWAAPSGTSSRLWWYSAAPTLVLVLLVPVVPYH